MLGCGGGGPSSSAWQAYVAECQADGGSASQCTCLANALDDKYASPDDLEGAGLQGVADLLNAASNCGIDLDSTE